MQPALPAGSMDYEPAVLTRKTFMRLILALLLLFACAATADDFTIAGR
jgi:hypothetical protein